MTSKNNDLFLFSLPQNPILLKLQNYRLESKFTDITLKVGEKKFAAHRMILDDSSPVLNVLLSEKRLDQNEFELNSKYVDIQIMEDLLTYLYTFQITLTPANAHMICMASYYLHIPALLTASEKYLSERITSENVLDLLLLSDKLELKVLQKKGFDLIVKNCEVLSNNSKLVSFEQEDLQMIFKELGKQKNNLKLKEAMFESLMKWIEKDYSARLFYLPGILKNIPLSDLSQKFLNEVVAKQSPIRDSHVCSSFLINAFSKTSAGSSQEVLEAAKTLSYIYCIGGQDEEPEVFLSTISRLDLSTRKWSLATKMRKLRIDYAVTVVGNKIFIIGGNIDEKKQSSMEMFDCSTGLWKDLAPMPYCRTCAAAVAIGDFIYVSGGTILSGGVAHITASMIRYSIMTDKWIEVNQMPMPRYLHRMIAHKDKIYSIGGAPLDHNVDQYNPNTDRWTKMADTSGVYFGFNAAVHDGKIWLRRMDDAFAGESGGFNGFEVFTPETNTWTLISAPCKYNTDKLVSMNGELWAIGTYSREYVKEFTKPVYVFDTKKKTWKRQPDMDVYRCSPDVFGVTV